MKRSFINCSMNKELICDTEPKFSVTDPDFCTESGFAKNASLFEIAGFYKSASAFSKFLKMLMVRCGGSVYIGKSYSDRVCMDWSDLDNYDAFVNLREAVNMKYDYTVSMPEDDRIIDYIIENDFRYFTGINLYFEKYDLLVEPNCHMSLLMYADETSGIFDTISEITVVCGLHIEQF